MKEYRISVSSLIAVCLLDNNLFEDGEYFYEEMLLDARDRLIKEAKKANRDAEGKVRFDVHQTLISGDIYKGIDGLYPWLKKVRKKIYLPTTSAYRDIYVINKNNNDKNIDMFPFSFNERRDLEGFLKTVLGSNFYRTLYPENTNKDEMAM